MTRRSASVMVLSHIQDRIRVTDAERTEKMQKKNVYPVCSFGDESRLGGDEGLRGTCKERIKRMSSAYITESKGQRTVN